MSSITIRTADPDDDAVVGKLVAQLGYADITIESSRRRLVQLLDKVDHAVFVAVTDGRIVVGFVHICVIETLEHEPRGEIRTLSVDEKHRSMGIGAQLVARAEEWARERRLVRVRVRSNVVRERARSFYERLGYRVSKTQNVFDKTL
jgi:GNAT superfamily N-acetyltransferase